MNNIFTKEEINNTLRQARSIVNQNDLAVEGILNKIKKRISLTDFDIGILLYAPKHFSKQIFNEAALLNEQLFEREINLYGVIYLSDFCVETCSYCGDNISSTRKENKSRVKRFLDIEGFKQDVNSLLNKYPNLKEICILSGDSPSLTVDKWIKHVEALFEVFKGKVILNKEPFNFIQFKQFRNIFSTKRLQFRVFQETYDPLIYEREHKYYGEIFENNQSKKNYLIRKKLLYPSKTNYDFRIMSQERAILAGFDEYGLGVLLGLNDGEHKSLFEILALKKHADYLYAKYGLWPATISFPRILPSVGVNYKIPAIVSDNTFIRLLAVTKLSIPYSKIINTCRESAKMRKLVRPLINIEDFEARPGPGGNSINNFICQMEITDRRTGVEILNEIKNQNFKIC